MSVLAAHVIRITHTGVYEDGRPHTESIHIDDLNEGRVFQNRKVQVYIPPNQTVDIPFSTRSLLSLDQGDIKGFIERGLITAQFVLRFRKIGDLGGSAGLGTTLRISGGDPNVERTGGIAKFVLDNDFESPVGFVVGERFSMIGLAGVFDDLNGQELIVTAINPGEDLTGANAAAFTIEVASLGPDIASGQDAGTSLVLLDGKITVLLEGAGNVGGVDDSDLYGYIGNQFYPLSITDSFATPVTIGTANADGSDNTHSRSDHVHNHGAQTDGSLHALVTTIVNGFMSAVDKTKLDTLSLGGGPVHATEVETATTSTTSGTFVDAMGGAFLNPPLDGDYLVIFEGDIGGSAGSTVNQIAIGLNSTTTDVSTSSRTMRGVGGAVVATLTHVILTGLVTSDEIHGLFRKFSGPGSTVMGNRRLTMFKVQ